MISDFCTDFLAKSNQKIRRRLKAQKKKKKINSRKPEIEVQKGKKFYSSTEGTVRT